MFLIQDLYVYCLCVLLAPDGVVYCSYAWITGSAKLYSTV